MGCEICSGVVAARILIVVIVLVVVLVLVVVVGYEECDNRVFCTPQKRITTLVSSISKCVSEKRCTNELHAVLFITEGFHVCPDAIEIAFAAVDWREDVGDFVVEALLGLRGAHLLRKWDIW